MQSIEELPDVIAKAFEIAASGRPGPVLIDIPKDIQIAPTDVTPFTYSVAKPTALSQAHLTDTLALLKQAKRPVLYVGAV